MSFSQRVKEELTGISVRARHCRLAELSALISFCGRSDQASAEGILLRTESPAVTGRVFTLLRKTIKIDSCVVTDKEGSPDESGTVIRITDPAEMERASELISFLGGGSDDQILQRSCCARAYLRGAFLAAGSVSDPEKSYHFEIVCTSEALSERVTAQIRRFGIDAHTVLRKGRQVVYVKEGTQIVDLLNVMGAHVSLMQMENVRIVKDVRNRVNRQVNCETANLTKTVNASVRQVEEIRFLEERGILKNLPQTLRQTAQLRVEHPEASLRELGEMHDPPIGRSGVNHRLKKISEIASDAAGPNKGSEVPRQQVSEAGGLIGYDQKRD